MKKHELYYTWKGMLDRCRNPRNRQFVRYGGRGITVCDRWRVFANFLTDMGPRPVGTTLDRIDNDKGYSPENCRWATIKQQQNNMRSNHYLTLNGVSKTISQWAAEHGVHFSVYHQRVYRGWSDERVLTTPVKGAVYGWEPKPIVRPYDHLQKKAARQLETPAS